MDLFVLVLLIVLAIGVLFIAGFAITDKLVDIYIRTKHPKWYEHFERATKNSFTLGGILRERIDTINKCIKAQQEAFLKGEISDEVFRGVMKVYTEEYQEVVEDYFKECERLGIDDDLKEAHSYAIEHNFKYGLLYKD